jgi:hypothetical protein
MIHCAQAARCWQCALCRAVGALIPIGCLGVVSRRSKAGASVSDVDVLRVATKSNPNTDVLTSIASSAWARRSAKNGTAVSNAEHVGRGGEGGRKVEEGTGKKVEEAPPDQPPAHSKKEEGTELADQEPLLRALYIQSSARRGLLHDLAQVLESARQGNLGREGTGPVVAGVGRGGGGGGGSAGAGAYNRSRLAFGGAGAGRPGGGEVVSAAGKVMVDMGVLTRSVQALQEAEALQERIQQLELVLSKYQDAVVTTVSQCADMWDYTQPGWRAPGVDAPASVADGNGKIVIIGGVRYEVEPGVNALRTVNKPHDLLQDPRLSVLREPFFSRGHGGHFGFKADVAERVRRVSESLTAALKTSCDCHPSRTPDDNSAASFPNPSAERHVGSSMQGHSVRGGEEAKSFGWTADAVREWRGAGIRGRSASEQPLPSSNASPPPAGAASSLTADAGRCGRSTDGSEHRRRSVDGLLRMDVEACQGLDTPGAYYKALTSLLAPEALLVESQVADASGVAAFRDQAGFFYVIRGSFSASVLPCSRCSCCGAVLHSKGRREAGAVVALRDKSSWWCR